MKELFNYKEKLKIENVVLIVDLKVNIVFVILCDRRYLEYFLQYVVMLCIDKVVRL